MPETKTPEGFDKLEESCIAMAQSYVEAVTSNIENGTGTDMEEVQVLSHMICTIERFVRMRSYGEGAKPYPLPA